MSGEESKRGKRGRADYPRSWKAWEARQRFLRFTWLPGEYTTWEPGKEREKRTPERDEGRRDDEA